MGILYPPRIARVLAKQEEQEMMRSCRVIRLWDISGTENMRS
jgi:hypothetical protein